MIDKGTGAVVEPYEVNAVEWGWHIELKMPYGMHSVVEKEIAKTPKKLQIPRLFR